MTEDQAREKWCPFVRAMCVYGEGDTTTGYNRVILACGNVGIDSHDGKHLKCIASDCMAWRWIGGGPNFETMKMEKPKFGYCGLAGKP